MSETRTPREWIIDPLHGGKNIYGEEWVRAFGTDKGILGGPCVGTGLILVREVLPDEI